MTTTTEFASIPKRKDHAFRKDIYLLGRCAESEELVWLEAPSWDCGWYWGFGYLETYTNPAHPSKSKDISSHTHWDGRIKGDFSYFAKTTFSQYEGDVLIELFKSFYDLKNKAEKAHRVDQETWENINQVQIPAITARIISILDKPVKK